MWQVPVPDGLLRGFGRLQDRLRLERWGLGTPLTAAAMEYYTRVPVPDNGPVEQRLGVRFRDPAATLGDCVAGLRAIGRL
jgi:hypothetical protein